MAILAIYCTEILFFSNVAKIVAFANSLIYLGRSVETTAYYSLSKHEYSIAATTRMVAAPPVLFENPIQIVAHTANEVAKHL